MSQSTLDDDELFDEAASEMREDVEEALDAARAPPRRRRLVPRTTLWAR